MYKYEYSLYITGGRKIYMQFNTLEELQEELSQYFSKSEKRMIGLLTTFDDDGWKEEFDGCWTQENKWRNFTISATKILEY